MQKEFTLKAAIAAGTEVGQVHENNGDQEQGHEARRSHQAAQLGLIFFLSIVLHTAEIIKNIMLRFTSHPCPPQRWVISLLTSTLCQNCLAARPAHRLFTRLSDFFVPL